MLTQIKSPDDQECAVHGSFSYLWPAIKEIGMNKMGRNHMHFAPGYPKDGSIISGMRKTCDLLIEADIEKSMKAGIKWFRSKNNVILTSGNEEGYLEFKFFK